MTIVKLITCQVENEQEQDFSQSQQIWKALSNCVGFRGQFGGWSQPERQAIIVGVWQSLEDVTAFMGSVHDELFSKSGQQTTYKQCDVHYFENILSIPSLTHHPADQNDNVIRLAYCRGVQDVERFLSDQRTIWNAHLGQADGMLGGCVARSLKQSDYFIVMTRWASNPAHENYVKTVLPTLKKQVLPESYIENMPSCLVQEECLWEVVPSNDSSVPARCITHPLQLFPDKAQTP
ncbi:YdbC family protein [Shewanella baltica]|uniref:YdbC family protein n=1 Tax=Shewanella baltica TaxID=62322 RepID=UPI00217D6E3F|nr:YdbC family protein [Shewanella baltica]MCS6158285.1 DUF4937 domain-containing protein [Shewanella baltica]